MHETETKNTVKRRGGVQFLNCSLMLLCMLPISTLFQPYPIFNNINRVIVILVFVCYFIAFFRMRLRHVYWVALYALVGLTAYNYLISPGTYATLNDPTYLPFWFLLMMVLTEGSRDVIAFFRNHLTVIKWILGIWTLIVGISILLPSSYETSWGGGTYFGSIPRSIFRLAPCACCVQVLSLAAVGLDRRNKDIYLLCQVVPLYCGFMGGSRTYFAVILLYFLLFLCFYSNTRRQLRIILVIAMLVGAAAFGISGIGSKVAATQYTNTSYFDFWGTITNGRSDIWITDFEYYFDADFACKLFGSGYDKVYELSLASRLNAAVYSHNDFINILITNGVVGLLLYVVPVIALLKHFCSQNSVSLFLLMVISAIWIGNAVFNMNYTYTCATIALGLLPTALHFALQTHPNSPRTPSLSPSATSLRQSK